MAKKMPPILDFLDDELTPLSHKAAAGFLRRAKATPKLVYSPIFLRFLEKYCRDALAELPSRATG